MQRYSSAKFVGFTDFLMEHRQVLPVAIQTWTPEPALWKHVKKKGKNTNVCKISWICATISLLFQKMLLSNLGISPILGALFSSIKMNFYYCDMINFYTVVHGDNCVRPFIQLVWFLTIEFDIWVKSRHMVSHLLRDNLAILLWSVIFFSHLHWLLYNVCMISKQF